MKEFWEGRMNNAIDRCLDELGRKAEAEPGRRNGFYGRWLSPERGRLELAIPRTRRTRGIKLLGGLAGPKRDPGRILPGAEYPQSGQGPASQQAPRFLLPQKG